MLPLVFVVQFLVSTTSNEITKNRTQCLEIFFWSMCLRQCWWRICVALMDDEPWNRWFQGPLPPQCWPQSQPNVASLWPDHIGTSTGKEKLQFPIHLLCLFLDCERKPEFRREPMQTQGEQGNSRQKGLTTRDRTTTFSLLGDSASQQFVKHSDHQRHVTFIVSQIPFLPHPDAHFDLQQVIFTTSTYLKTWGSLIRDLC